MDDLIARVHTAAGVQPEVAEKAIGMILAFLRKEAPKADVDDIFAEIPGAAAAADAADASGGGALSGLMGMMGGGLMGLAARLSGLGLSMGQMQAVGSELFTYARERAGDERITQLAASVPGLNQLL